MRIKKSTDRKEEKVFVFLCSSKKTEFEGGKNKKQKRINMREKKRKTPENAKR
jgi:hypothetical protein